MEVKDTEFIGIRVPRKLRELMKEYIRLDTHLNESEFVRTAIREKLQNDAPGLRDRLFEVGLKEKGGERATLERTPALLDPPKTQSDGGPSNIGN